MRFNRSWQLNRSVSSLPRVWYVSRSPKVLNVEWSGRGSVSFSLEADFGRKYAHTMTNKCIVDNAGEIFLISMLCHSGCLWFYCDSIHSWYIQHSFNRCYTIEIHLQNTTTFNTISDAQIDHIYDDDDDNDDDDDDDVHMLSLLTANTLLSCRSWLDHTFDCCSLRWLEVAQSFPSW